MRENAYSPIQHTTDDCLIPYTVFQKVASELSSWLVKESTHINQHINFSKVRHIVIVIFQWSRSWFLRIFTLARAMERASEADVIISQKSVPLSLYHSDSGNELTILRNPRRSAFESLYIVKLGVS